jgi:hypothetical protein
MTDPFWINGSVVGAYYNTVIGTADPNKLGQLKIKKKMEDKFIIKSMVLALLL